LQSDVEKAISSAGRFLMGKKGYRRLETSDDPDHFWMAKVDNSPQIAMRIRTLAPFEIGFDCKPQRFLKSGEIPIELDYGRPLYNPYGEIALPLITVYGQGAGRLTFGDRVVVIKELDGTLILDSDTQNAYNDKGDQNSKIDAPLFPILPDGEIEIEMIGDIERIEIIPRWWEI
jgi:phage-related protein